MMKNTVHYALLMCLCLILSSFRDFLPLDRVATPHGTDQINFIENSWDLAVKKAKKEHKYIFVDVYAVWCGPCKLLKNTTFKDKKIANFFNQNFVNISIDAEKGEGIKLAERWEVEVYPTLLILDSDGVIVAQGQGYVEAKALLDFGQNVLKDQKKQ